jgi:uncharacterized protein YeaO (DUF488 family)
MAVIRTKRVYEPAEESDGFRVLVDRLWPRGLTKEKARIDLWAKDIAPSTELRQWYHAHLDQWAEFRKRYFAELDGADTALAAIVAAAHGRPITLLYAAKTPGHTHADVLKERLAGLR